MAKAGKERRASKKPRIRFPIFKDPHLHLWKAFLIVAVAIPAIIAAFYWYQANFETKELFDKVTSDRVIFSVLMGFGCSSLVVQYYLLPQEKRKQEVIRKTPILILIGVGVAIIALMLVWWQNPDASARSMISKVAHKPFVLVASAGFALEGMVMAFLLSSREEQKRVVQASLMLFAAFLTFGGPTYLLYVLQGLAIPRLLLLLFGLASFTVGIILFAHLLGGERKIGAST